MAASIRLPSVIHAVSPSPWSTVAGSVGKSPVSNPDGIGEDDEIDAGAVAVPSTVVAHPASSRAASVAITSGARCTVRIVP